MMSIRHVDFVPNYPHFTLCNSYVIAMLLSKLLLLICRVLHLMWPHCRRRGFVAVAVHAYLMGVDDLVEC